jgi:hypothetical protein
MFLSYYQYRSQLYLFIIARETTEGWPLLVVEAESNWDSRSTSERGPFLGWFVGLVEQVQEIFVLPWLLKPTYYNFFLTVHYFISFVPVAQQAGQAVVPRRLKMSVCDYCHHNLLSEKSDY